MQDTFPDNERFKLIEKIFARVYSTSENERWELLDLLCAGDEDVRLEVESLLSAAGCAKGFLSIAPEAVEQIMSEKLNPDLLLNRHFGAYRLLRVLERGGMGVVFLAERADGHYQEQVAIKFANHKICASSLMTRFNRERQILATIRHPNVARLLDGGTSADGYPYLVMEYIRGLPIDSYCQVNELAAENILELFLIVCTTVQHAQQHLIVHCDLKPDNIMVTADGTPRLLDFGIAQLLDPICNQLAMSDGATTLAPRTPEYAAPEQLTGDQITTATDVYSLGRILDQLLKGASSQPAPSGDLDNIVARALSPDPAARYSSAEHLGNEIQRFLEGRPVIASGSGVGYRIRKFLGRHQLGVCLASLAVTSILIGMVTTTVQWQNAKSEREIAESRLIEVRDLANTIAFDLPKTIATLPGSTPLRERLLNQGIAYLDRLSSEQQNPELMHELAIAYHELATLQGNPMIANLGNPQAALSNYRKSIALHEAVLIDDPENFMARTSLAKSYSFMSAIYGGNLNDAKQARTLSDQCISLLTPLATDANATTTGRLLSCLTIGAHWANAESDYPAATRYLQHADIVLRNMSVSGNSLPPGQEQRLKGRVHEEWAQVHAGRGNHSLAVSHERKRLELWSVMSEQHGSRSRQLGAAYHGLAARLATDGSQVEALDAYRSALNYWRDWRERYPADVSAMQAIAVVLAEIADVRWQMSFDNAAGQNDRQAASTIACRYYEQSIAALHESAIGTRPLAHRYPWSPTAVQIRNQKTARCQCDSEV